MKANFAQEKAGPTVTAVNRPETKNHVVDELLGDSECTAHLTAIQREWRLVQEAYNRGLREGLSQGPSHPAVVQSVANFFGGWQGIEAARARSTQRFWKDYRERDAA